MVSAPGRYGVPCVAVLLNDFDASGLLRKAMNARAHSLPAPFFSSTASWRIGEYRVSGTIHIESGVLADNLRQRHESEFRIAGLDELECLGDVVALHDFSAQLLVESERFHGLDRRCSVRRRQRIGDRNFFEFSRRAEPPRHS